MFGSGREEGLLRGLVGSVKSVMDTISRGRVGREMDNARGSIGRTGGVELEVFLEVGVA